MHFLYFNFPEEEEKKNRENADSIIAKILAEENNLAPAFEHEISK